MKCKEIESIRRKRKETEEEIQNLLNKQGMLNANKEEEILELEDRLNRINMEIKSSQLKFEVQKHSFKGDLVLSVNKDCIVSAENMNDETISSRFTVICGYKNLKLYEDAYDFFFTIPQGTSQKVSSEFTDEISLDLMTESNAIFNVKSKCAKTIYNLILKKSNLDVFSEVFTEKVKHFNEFFKSTAFYKKDLTAFEVKIRMKYLRDEILQSHPAQDLQKDNENKISRSVYDFVRLYKILEIYTDQKSLINPNIEQAVKNFFNSNKSNSLFDKLVQFSDACYFGKQISKYRHIKESAFDEIYKFLDLKVESEDDAENIKQVARAFNEKVDLIFQDHWNNTLKSFFLDRIYQSFMDYIANLEHIKQYEAFDLTTISKILSEIGVSRLDEFPKIFITRQKNNCEITDEEFEMIMEKIEF